MSTQAVPTNGRAMPPMGNTASPVEDKSVLVYDEIISRYTSTVRYSWYEVGEAAKKIKEGELWQFYSAPQGQDAFHGWDDYVNRRADGRGRSSIYRALQLRNGLEKVGEIDARRITQQNAIWLLKGVTRLGESKGLSERWVQNAIEMTEKDFKEFCQDNLPGAAKEEQRVQLFKPFEKSQAKAITEGLNAMKRKAEIEDDSEALEAIVVEWLEHGCEVEGMTAKSNREAFGHQKKAKKKPN